MINFFSVPLNTILTCLLIALIIYFFWPKIRKYYFYGWEFGATADTETEALQQFINSGAEPFAVGVKFVPVKEKNILTPNKEPAMMPVTVIYFKQKKFRLLFKQIKEAEANKKA